MPRKFCGYFAILCFGYFYIFDFSIIFELLHIFVQQPLFLIYREIQRLIITLPSEVGFTSTASLPNTFTLKEDFVSV